MTAPAHDPERERLVRAVEEANAAAMRCRLRHGRISEELAQMAIDAQSALTEHKNAFDRRDRLWSKRQSLAQSNRRAKEKEQQVESARAALAAHDQARGPTVPTRTASGYRNQAAPDE